MEGPDNAVDAFLQTTRDFQRFSPKMRLDPLPFSREVYEKSRSKRFDSLEQAYADWLSYGRGEGHDFEHESNTLLKVVVKVKDEPEFLPLWISYYCKLVGCHNIIIVDCGSTNPAHLNLLREVSSKVLVLSYARHYDDLHHIQTNREFYGFISSACKYISLLDADEFLFGYSDGQMGPDCVEPILRCGNEWAYAGTWFSNSAPFTKKHLDTPLDFNIDQNVMKFGTIAGKSILRSSMCLHVINLGHNLHVLENLDLFAPASFGKFGIFHFTKSERRIARHRSLKHLRSKGVISNALSSEIEIEAYLKRMLMDGKIRGIEAHYAQKYVGIATAEEVAGGTFEATLGTTTTSAVFSRAMTEFDFSSLLEQRRKELRRSREPA